MSIKSITHLVYYSVHEHKSLGRLLYRSSLAVPIVQMHLFLDWSSYYLPSIKRFSAISKIIICTFVSFYFLQEKEIYLAGADSLFRKCLSFCNYKLSVFLLHCIF